MVSVRRFHGTLPAGGASVTEVPLERGIYVVRAACGRGCESLRLRVESAAGALVEAPAAPSYQAGARIEVDANGVHRVRIELPGCSSAAGCAYGFVLFGIA